MANTQPINQVISEYITNEFKGTAYESDIWDCEHLGLKNTLIHSMYKLNFTTISPLWLKLVAKKFIKHILHTKKFSTATSCNSAIVRLGWFIMAHKPECSPENINREFILAFLNYLSATNLAPNTKRLTVIHIRSFIETVVFEGWLPFSKKRIIFEQDMLPMKTPPIPRFVPESVMDQLVLHINLLPEDQARAVLVLIETGRRISELCTLPIDCLKYDNSSYPFLEINDQKTKKIYLIPISKKCENIIKTQQTWLTKHSLEQYGYLFTGMINSRSPCIKAKNLNRILNKLAIENNILGSDGKVWYFQAHQFRHTVGTRMINAGVSPFIVQRYLGHESPEMTSRYAHIHDQTLKEAFNTFQNNTDKTLAVMNSYKLDENNWLRSNVMAQALPNGYCNLPLSQDCCPHANACLNCANFKTDLIHLAQHKQQLATTEKLLELAEKNNWHKQIKINTEIKTRLKKIIHSVAGSENV